MKISAVSASKFIHLKRHMIVSKKIGYRKVEPQERIRSPISMNLVSLSSKVTIIASVNYQDHQLMERSLPIHNIRSNPISILVPDYFSPFLSSQTTVSRFPTAINRLKKSRKTYFSVNMND
jgi:hypothetical protein